MPPYFFKSSKTEGMVAIAGGTALFYLAPKDTPGHLITKLVGGFAIGYGIQQLFFSAGGFFADTGRALTDEAAIPVDAPGATITDKLLGLFGRVTGQEPSPGITTAPDRGATSGPHLGQPKNLLRVAGVIRNPLSGGTVKVPLAADTFAVEAAIENQSSEMRSGLIQARVMITGETTPLVIPGNRVMLAPGEMQTVNIRVPYRHVGFTPFKNHTVALLFENYKLAESTFDIDRVFF